MSHESLCTDCDINKVVSPERRELCESLARDIIQQYWHGDPLATLRNIATAEICGEGLKPLEEEQLLGCMSEHSSGRCDNLNPYGS